MPIHFARKMAQIGCRSRANYRLSRRRAVAVNNLQPTKTTSQSLIQGIENLLPRLFPGLTRVGYIDFEDSLPHFHRREAIALRALAHSELLQRKSTFRTLAQGRDSKLKTSN